MVGIEPKNPLLNAIEAGKECQEQNEIVEEVNSEVVEEIVEENIAEDGATD